MPKKVISCKFDNKTIKVENTWFHGASLFIDDELIGKNNSLYHNYGRGPFIIGKYKFSSGEKIIEVFCSGIWTIKFKICIEEKMIGGIYFKTYLPKQIERKRNYILEFSNKFASYKIIGWIILFILCFIYKPIRNIFIILCKKITIVLGIEEIGYLYFLITTLFVFFILELLLAILAIIIKKNKPELMTKIIGENNFSIYYEKTNY